MPVPSLPDLSNIDPNDSRQIVDTLAKIKKELEWLVLHLDGQNISANAIEAKHIQSDAIQAQHIQSGAIETRHISVQGLDAGVIKTGTLLFDRIRGGTAILGGMGNANGVLIIYPASGSLYIQIDSSGLRLINGSTGDVLYHMDLSTSIVRYSGSTHFTSPSNVLFEGYVTFRYPTMVMASSTERGFCGVGGVGNGEFTAQAGVGVNFRISKTYSPSTVYLFPYSSNTSPIVIDISPHGFWLYVTGDGTTAYKYWRGVYEA